jgi:hypothetical protein
MQYAEGINIEYIFYGITDYLQLYWNLIMSFYRYIKVIFFNRNY